MYKAQMALIYHQMPYCIKLGKEISTMGSMEAAMMTSFADVGSLPLIFIQWLWNFQCLEEGVKILILL